MSSGERASNGVEEEERPRLLWVEIGDWPGLGGRAGFELSERVTVLVGKNGSRKSLLIDGIRSAASATVMGTRILSAPKFFKCSINRPDAPIFSYEFRLESKDSALIIDSEDIESQAGRSSWDERCWLEENTTNLWAIQNSQLALNAHAPIPFPHGEGLVGEAVFRDSNIPKIPIEAIQLAEIFQGMRWVSAGIPRGEGGRQEILMSRTGKAGWRPVNGKTDGITGLVSLILLMEWAGDDSLSAYVELLRQLEIVHDVNIRHYGTTDARQTSESYAAVQFDGINIGLCSDGTLRAAQIIAQLLSPRLRCLLIEEPETAVHPSLLSRLLNILESYSLDRQIVIATHSPQVVDWCKPEDLRLVERTNGVTGVRKLDKAELARMHNYLTHDGPISDLLYFSDLVDRQSSE